MKFTNEVRYLGGVCVDAPEPLVINEAAQVILIKDNAIRVADVFSDEERQRNRLFILPQRSEFQRAPNDRKTNRNKQQESKYIFGRSPCVSSEHVVTTTLAMI